MDKLYSICITNISLGVYEILGNSKFIYKIHRIEAENTISLNKDIENKLSDSNFPKILKDCHEEIQKYFQGELKEFSILKYLYFEGTPFQIKVWKIMSEIPYGKTITYGDLAALAGNPKACRSVGSICNKNPFGLVVPCHRVLAKGSLGGFRNGITLKKKLLDLEQKHLKI